MRWFFGCPGACGVRIAVAGSGLAGSYLYRLLKMRTDHKVHLYDVKHKVACHIHPCGYGVDEHFDPLILLGGLDPDRYRLHNPPHHLAQLEGVVARSTVFMIDKPRLVHDLQQGIDVRMDAIDAHEYDLIVDATG